MSKNLKKATLKKNSPAGVKISATETTLPGYIRFSGEVFSQLFSNKRLFGGLLGLAVIALLLVAGITQSNQYAQLSEATDQASSVVAAGFTKYTLEVVSLLSLVATGTYVSALSEIQQLYMGMVFLTLWLVTIWMLRYLSSGSKVKLRDGLYNASAPFISTLLIVLFGLLQLVPFGLFVALVSLTSSSGVLSGTLAVIASILLILALFALTIYWLVGTLFAAVIVTIPGTYPVAALRSAREVVTGHRARIFKRVLWLFVMMVGAYVLLLIPMIAINVALSYNLTLLITLFVQALTVCLFIYSTAYIYTLYRRIIDERTE